MARTGRPSKFTKALADTLCLRVACGEVLSRICREESMPDRATVWRWTEEHEDFRNSLRAARESGSHALIDEAVEIADDGRNDWMELQTKSGVKVVLDREHVDRSKLRVETRKWLASKVAPRAYGDKVTTELTGPNGGPVQFQTVADLARAMAAAPPSKPSDPPAAAEGAS